MYIRNSWSFVSGYAAYTCIDYTTAQINTFVLHNQLMQSQISIHLELYLWPPHKCSSPIFTLLVAVLYNIDWCTFKSALCNNNMVHFYCGFNLGLNVLWKENLFHWCETSVTKENHNSSYMQCTRVTWINTIRPFHWCWLLPQVHRHKKALWPEGVK